MQYNFNDIYVALVSLVARLGPCNIDSPTLFCFSSSHPKAIAYANVPLTCELFATFMSTPSNFLRARVLACVLPNRKKSTSNPRSRSTTISAHYVNLFMNIFIRSFFLFRSKNGGLMCTKYWQSS